MFYIPQKQKDIIYYILTLTILISCNTPKNIIYLEDLKQSPEIDAKIQNSKEPKIQTDDLLGITVSSLNPESNVLFNNGTLITPGAANNNLSNTKSYEGYLVDQSGTINFPVLGKIKVAGLTKTEASEKLTQEIKKYVKDPIVNIRFLNFKITVLGEVNKPSSYTLPTDRINVIEALGLAGDMTIYGERDNVLIIREKDGLRSTERLDLSKKSVLNSPYFYLQQNDIVYVEPGKERAAQLSTTRSNISLGISIISLITIIITRIL